MKRIKNLLLTAACTLCFTLSIYGQTCTFTSTAPGSVVFGSSIPVTTPSFSGTAVSGFIQNGTSSLTSPIYYYPAGVSALHFRINLNPANGTQPAITPVITINYGVGGLQTITCNGTSFVPPTDNAADYYFSISPLLSFPANTNFTVTLSLITGNRAIIPINFASNAILAPAGAVLPVRFSLFTAKPSATGVLLTWKTDTEENLEHYVVERSNDGRNFTPLAIIDPAGPGTYNYKDVQSVGNGFYRVRAVENDGRFTLTPIVRINEKGAGVVIKAFFKTPGQLVLQHDLAAEGNSVEIFSADGRQIALTKLIPGSQQTLVNVSSAGQGLLIIRYNMGENNGMIKLVKNQ